MEGLDCIHSRLSPAGGGELAGGILQGEKGELSAADEEGEAAFRSEEAEGKRKHSIEVLDGAEGDDIGPGDHGSRFGGSASGRWDNGIRGSFQGPVAGFRHWGREARIGFGISGASIGEGLGALGDYIDVRQCKGTSNFTEESGLFVIGFDERQMNFWRPDFYGKTGESGSGAEV